MVQWQVELEEQPVRNIVNIYAWKQSMKEQNCLAHDDLQNTLLGETLLCGNFNARGELKSNTVTSGELLEDSLDQSDLTCINNVSILRTATRPGDTDRIIDLANSILQIANRCTFVYHELATCHVQYS